MSNSIAHRSSFTLTAVVQRSIAIAQRSTKWSPSRKSTNRCRRASFFLLGKRQSDDHISSSRHKMVFIFKSIYNIYLINRLRFPFRSHNRAHVATAYEEEVEEQRRRKNQQNIHWNDFLDTEWSSTFIARSVAALFGYGRSKNSTRNIFFCVSVAHTWKQLNW